MNKLFLIPLVVVIFTLSGMFVNLSYFAEPLTSENSFIPAYLPGSIAEAYQLSDAPSKTICDAEQIPFTENIMGSKIKTLKVLPEKYKISRVVDIGPHIGMMQVTYSFGECGASGSSDPRYGGIDLKSSFVIKENMNNSTLASIKDLSGQDRIDKLSNIHTKTLNDIDFTHPWYENDRIVTVNGHSAMLSEPGYTTDRYWDYDSGELLYKETIPYPAQIRFVDENFESYYQITGYFGSEELIKMAESLE